jgi:hypothetical protein
MGYKRLGTAHPDRNRLSRPNVARRLHCESLLPQGPLSYPGNLLFRRPPAVSGIPILLSTCNSRTCRRGRGFAEFSRTADDPPNYLPGLGAGAFPVIHFFICRLPRRCWHTARSHSCPLPLLNLLRGHPLTISSTGPYVRDQRHARSFDQGARSNLH